PASAPPPPVEALPPVAVVTPFPPDLPDVAPVHKRRLVIAAFDYSAVKDWVQAWFNTEANIGEGIQAMLTTRLQQSPNITVLERSKLPSVMQELDLQRTSVVDPATKIVRGHVLGAESIVTGNITIFGRDDKTKKKGVLGGILVPHNSILGALAGITLLDK